ncbi:hypothetical protein HDV01_007355 [Terramyces sp. JEL0728]|nr:hypothetical protein HDV01_007355 [Terramyces sp. JEL0728]
MANAFEIAIRQATESVRIAEERLATFMNSNPNDYSSAGFLTLSGMVTNAQITLQVLAAQSRGIVKCLTTEHRITLHQYLQIIPPPPNYARALPGPSSTIPEDVRNPQLTEYWEQFEEDVMRFIQNDIEPNTELVIPPVFENIRTTITSEIPMLQSFISSNLFETVTLHMDCKVITSEYGRSVGDTDSHIEKNVIEMNGDVNTKVVLVNEYKGKWTLNPEWFQDGRIDMFVGKELLLGTNHNFIRNAVNQIYYYMTINHLQYGTLTSFEHTFFLKRVKVEDACDGLETLVISKGIPYNSTNPTILQCIAYILSLADGAPFSSPPTSPVRMQSVSLPREVNRESSTVGRYNTLASRINSVTNIQHSSQYDSQPNSGTDLTLTLTENNTKDNESHFSLEDFSIKSILGYGRTKVYYEAKHQLALKAIDLWKQSHLLPELQNEVQVYNLLFDLQGIGIPQMVLHGYWEGGMYCLGFSMCGNVPQTLTESQKQSILSTIDAIHSRGILHNDIKKDNMLVDENGSVFLIDFGFATQNASKDKQEYERKQLVRCIECL